MIPIADDLLYVLQRVRRAQGFVFTDDDGKPIYSKNANDALKRICKQNGLRHIGWHALRHTFASQLVMRGAPIRHVQDLMGHCSVQMTERYSHLAPADLQKAIALFKLEAPKTPTFENLGLQVGNTWQKMFMQV